MKENLKNQLFIFLVLLCMMALVFICTLLVVIDIFWVVKIFVVVATILLTFYLFVTIKKINKKLVYVEREDSVEIKTINITEQKIRCPKCYNFYDGEYCFVCGYKKENIS